jgi:hypothetical protein
LTDDIMERMFDLNQKTEMQGVTITLERIELSEMGVVGCMSVLNLPDESFHSIIRGQALIRTTHVPLGYSGLAHWIRPRGIPTFVVFNRRLHNRPLVEQYGGWELTLRCLQYMPIVHPSPRDSVDSAGAIRIMPGEQVPLMPISEGFTAIPGTWVFKFTVPLVTE